MITPNPEHLTGELLVENLIDAERERARRVESVLSALRAQAVAAAVRLGRLHDHRQQQLFHRGAFALVTLRGNNRTSSRA